MKLTHCAAATILAAFISQAVFGDNDKAATKSPTAIEKAVGSLPAVKPAELEAGNDLRALERHLARVTRATDGEAEARELEALLGWLRSREVEDHFMVTLGLRCPALTDEELLVLSAWPTVKLTIDGYVRPPVATTRDITFKDPRNVLRLVPLTATAKSIANR